MPAGVCPELWCIENPSVIGSVHGDYARAGCDIVYTCTFGANRFKLGQYGEPDARSVNRRLALIAKEAVRGKALVAGDIGPTGHFVQPFGEVDFEEAVAVFKEQVRGLLEGGVDCFVIETMMDIQEARAALIAVKETCDLFTMVTMTFERDGRTLNGTDPLTALITLQSPGRRCRGLQLLHGARRHGALHRGHEALRKDPPDRQAQRRAAEDSWATRPSSTWTPPTSPPGQAPSSLQASQSWAAAAARRRDTSPP